MTKGVIAVTNTIKDKVNNINKNGFSDFLLPDIKISSNTEAVIDGCYGVIEYSDTTVRINCKSLILKFSGTNLCIKTVSVLQYSVKGNITSVEFFSC